MGDEQLMTLFLIQQNPKQYAQELIANALIRKKNFFFFKIIAMTLYFREKERKLHQPQDPKPPNQPESNWNTQ